jgi:hypothetical protein
MEHYIRLLTAEELTEEQMELWISTVEDFAPNDTVISSEIDEDQDCTDEDESHCGDPDFPYVYIVLLTRHLESSEAEFVVASWEGRYDGDFEIEISFLYRPDADLQHPFDINIDDESKDEILTAAAKFLHNRWVEAKTIEGWRYGMHYSDEQRTNPSLRNWDDLAPDYRKTPQLSDKELLDFYTQYKYLFV